MYFEIWQNFMENMIIGDGVVGGGGAYSANLWDTRRRDLSDIECDFSRSLKAISNDAVGLPIYDFLLMYN